MHRGASQSLSHLTNDVLLPTMTTRIPILLLKTRSSPTDGYEDQFSTPQHGLTFSPTFVPVLEHQLLDDGMNTFRNLLERKEIGEGQGKKYGGLIFTSQRAVEAFAQLVAEGRLNDPSYPHLAPSTPIYTVGPATSRALSALSTPSSPLTILGQETGNGEALAQYILSHYPSDSKSKFKSRLPLLFLVGEQRRDIIPKTLSSPSLEASNRIAVDEITIYGTGIMASFERDFKAVLKRTENVGRRWVVVFSPTGCEAMLRALGCLGDARGKAGGERDGKTFVASIGPTTRDFLRAEFGFEVDVCAERPSPEGVLEGIWGFMEGLGGMG
ncbi:uroporphyrinogen-III synthase [Mollisia scopiformis]|uniref:Uroporphyrinogen-III synthase n=1 Tax=Mollisia scopiformis TaxID=149040 RepID=A0A194X3U4_MOLSC|nr:uroporphyrinogen-III synthase [Mollisia scopiformis]KUJ14841.1 uroporphyrinogen-III synthase [Mollisia scopiformis]